ncbi:MAG: hypothetical protein K6T76_14595 [Alicyclobacillus mali]|uniref:hypothetical protein n=1 Tax=Alicyclobacillus mali (ex Roth et al. 2021) TaxID=1123961 RepID=UPI00018A7B52|nr:hypothetical protein [Alicyclobacillus mali (ex Roth et al. 2021)]MCL6490147.1 hypothetical protein [Alicyclobacillus mali (ex Roth et al. 2021)]
MRLSVRDAEVQVIAEDSGIRLMMRDEHGTLELVLDESTARKLRDGLDLALRRGDGPRSGGPLVVS